MHDQAGQTETNTESKREDMRGDKGEPKKVTGEKPDVEMKAEKRGDEGREAGREDMKAETGADQGRSWTSWTRTRCT